MCVVIVVFCCWLCRATDPAQAWLCVLMGGLRCKASVRLLALILLIVCSCCVCSFLFHVVLLVLAAGTGWEPGASLDVCPPGRPVVQGQRSSPRDGFERDCIFCVFLELFVHGPVPASALRYCSLSSLSLCFCCLLFPLRQRLSFYGL